MKIFLSFLLSLSILFAKPLDIDENLYQSVKDYNNIVLLKKQYISLDDDFYKDYIPRDTNVNEEMTGPQRDLVEDTIYMQVFMIGTMAILFALPPSVTKWDPDKLKEKSLSQRWKENVKAGPVWDEDDFFINYIGHPVSGAWYYTVARNDGMDEFDSFLYSVFVSTFVWEYGYEAFAEIPSIQDLIATPVVGALMGEYFYYLESEIDKNHGLVWGSSTLGNVSYFFLNPIGRITNNMSEFFDVSVTMRFQTYQPYNSMRVQDYNTYINKPKQFSSFDYGMVLDFNF